jgi:hypothetical protein
MICKPRVHAHGTEFSLPSGKMKPTQNNKIWRFWRLKKRVPSESSKEGAFHALRRAWLRLSCRSRGVNCSGRNRLGGPTTYTSCSTISSDIDIDSGCDTRLWGRFRGLYMLRGKLPSEGVFVLPLFAVGRRLSEASVEESGAPIDVRSPRR